jgi:hypothetical protein
VQVRVYAEDSKLETMRVRLSEELLGTLRKLELTATVVAGLRPIVKPSMALRRVKSVKRQEVPGWIVQMGGD